MNGKDKFKTGIKKDIIPSLNSSLIKRLEKNVIGSVISSVEFPIIVSIKKDKSLIPIRVEVKNAKSLELFSYLLIYDYSRNKILAVQLKEHQIRDMDKSDFQSMLMGESFDAIAMIEKNVLAFSKHPHLFIGTPVGTFSYKADEDVDMIEIIREGGVRFAPITNSPCYIPNLEDMFKILGVPREGLFFGIYTVGHQLFDQNNQYVPIYLSENLLRRHISINGKTGTGKTELFKTIIIQLVKEKSYAVFATDTQGDIVSQIYKPINKNSKQWKEIEDNKEQLIWKAANWSNDFILEDNDLEEIGAIIEGDKLTVLIPIKESIPKDISSDLKVVQFGIPSSQIPNGRLLSIYLPNLTDQSRSSLPSLFNVYTQSYGNFDLKLFRNWLTNVKSVTGTENKKIDKILVKNDNKEFNITFNNISANIHIASLGNLIRSIQNLIDLDIFDQGGKDLKYDDLLIEGHLTILYLPREMDPIKKRIYEHQLMNIILENREKHQKRAIIIDEAQDVIPNYTQESKEFGNLVARLFREIATQGRKYNICLIVGSQEPSQIHPVVFGQCNSRIFFCLSHKDIETIRRYIPKDYLSQLTDYKSGYGILYSPNNMTVPVLEIKTPRAPVLHKNITEGETEL